jgi:prepilin-type N-terminal cleavage/methylation domain-containing protein
MSLRSVRKAGFTLVEILVAVAILTIFGLTLCSLFSESTSIWIRGQNENDYRNRARAALNYIKRDLQVANLAANQPSLAGSPTLELMTDPPGTVGFPDSFFWQAPIATDDRSEGDMAEVGYFVRWINGRGTLCRFFVNPSDPASYKVYSGSPGQWISQAFLDQVAPGTSASLYRGLFLNDIVGLWIQVFPDPALSTSAYTNPFDSSSPPDPTHPLPDYAVIQIATLDAPTAIRAAQAYHSGSSSPSEFASAYVAAGTAAASATSANAEIFASALNQIPLIRGGAKAFSLRVHFNNYRTFASP